MSERIVRNGCWFSLPLAFLLLSCAAIGQQDLQGDLDAARARWRGAGLQSYTYDYQRTCFCPPEMTRQVNVRVLDGAVTAATYSDDGQPVDPQFVSSFMTVEQLFDQLQEAISVRPVEMTVTYDPTYGYPVSAYVDYDEYMADEELRFSAGAVAPIH